MTRSSRLLMLAGTPLVYEILPFNIDEYQPESIIKVRQRKEIVNEHYPTFPNS